MKSLTQKQRDILEFIRDFSEQNGMSPTIYEIADFFRIKTSTAFFHLIALQKKKYIFRSSKARSILLTKQSIRNLSGEQPAVSLFKIPDFSEVKENAIESVYCDISLLSGNQEFAKPEHCIAILVEENVLSRMLNAQVATVKFLLDRQQKRFGSN